MCMCMCMCVCVCVRVCAHACVCMYTMLMFMCFSPLASHFLLPMVHYAMGTRISRIGGTMETHAHYFVEVV